MAVKKKQKTPQEVQPWSVFVWARRHSIHHAQPRQTAMDWQRWCIFIILLKCAWCAIRIEISPARDVEFFMRVIWAVFDLQTMSWLYFSPHDELIETFKWGSKDSHCCISTRQSSSTEGKGLRVTPAASALMALTGYFWSTLSLLCLPTAVTACTQQLNGVPILCCAFSPFRASLRDSLHRGIRPRRTRTAWRTDMGTLLHVRTTADHGFLHAGPILQADYWPWITLSCSNTVLLSANKSSFDLCSLTFLFIFLLCLCSCVKINPVFTWLLPCNHFFFLFFFK